MNQLKTMKEDLLRHKLIAIIRNVDPQKVEQVVEALYAGGIVFAEITLNSKNALPLISLLSEQWKGRMYIGAGTVRNQSEAQDAIEHGAQFLVSPHTDPDIIRYCCEHNTLILPGAMTPTEIMACVNAGADFVKIFPAGSLGEQYVKDLKGPLNEVYLFAVGGITPDHIPAFLRSGASGFGIGGNLCNLDLIAANQFESITEMAKQYTDHIHDMNGNHQTLPI